MRRVLVIDDDAALRNMLAATFESIGYAYVLAASVIDGIAHAEAGRFDVALIDMRMPGLNGLEAVKAIAHLTPRIPIVAMSGGSSDGLDYPVIAVHVGAQRFLPKPFTRAQLVAAIDSVLAG